MNSAEQLPDNDFDADFEGEFAEGAFSGDPLAPIELQLTKDVCGERLDKVVARFKGFGPKKVLLEYLTLKE